jgi:ketosteroid isomerase-like protein
MKLFPVILAVFALFFASSCGRDTKQTQSSLTGIDEEKQFALTLYGDEVKVIAKGDLLGNSKQAAIAAVVMKQTDNSYWIRKGSFFQKEADGWKVLLKMEEKLFTDKGDLISRVNANNGYIIRFDSSEKPISINIVMANEYGKGASDEALLIWNSDKQTFDFDAPDNGLSQ